MNLLTFSRKIKLSHDPNNTKWTGNTDSFGHKIMQAQGWQPGDFLGARNANHAEHYTAANASHIRVLIKDDNLGLGAKIGSGVGHGECTGLDMFKDILGRLNGKDEDEIKKEQKSREDLKRAIYTEKKWGSVRFVQGGFLVGDKIQHLIDGEAERIRKLKAVHSPENSDSSSSSSDSEEETFAPLEKSKRVKKRKIDEEETPEVVAIKTNKSKKRRKIEDSSKFDEDKVESIQLEETEKQRRKRERKEKQERKQRKRELKKSLAGVSEGVSKKVKEKRKRKIGSIPDSPDATSGATTKESTPSTPLVDSGRSNPIMQGRHAVRARNIAQKRLASMDVASLNQVWQFNIFLCTLPNSSRFL